MIKFLFDLDGTLTKTETLPLIAEHFYKESSMQASAQVSMEEMTKEGLLGAIPFEENFSKRVDILKHFPIDTINSLLEKIPVFPLLERFIRENKNDCAIATSNLDCWIEKLCQRFTCETHTSSALYENNQVIKITNILQKETLVKKFQKLGYTVVFIGDGNNDIEAMKCANISIVSALLHTPPKQLLDVAHYTFYEEDALYQTLIEVLRRYN